MSESHTHVMACHQRYSTDGDDFGAAMKLLIKAMDEDVSHARGHTKILTRAIDWERHDFPSSLLLKGSGQLPHHIISCSPTPCRRCLAILHMYVS
jgi:hypothetical protein